MTSLVTPIDAFQPVDWKTVDDACFDWVADSLTDQVDVSSIIWEQQKIPQPGYPYISLLRGAEIDQGGVDEVRQRSLDVDDKIIGQDPGAGDPVINEQVIYQPIRWTLTVQAHADPEAGGNDPGCDPVFLLGRVKRAIGKTAVVNNLSTAGISIVEKLALNDTSVVTGGVWISRATMDVIMSTTAVMTERVGFMDKVQVESSALGVDFTIDASI